MIKNVRKSATMGNLTITWFGHAAFLLESRLGKRVLIDPWLDNPKAPDGARDIAGVDLILVTHGHSDHVGNTVEVAQRSGAKVVSIHEIALYLQQKGVAAAQGMNKGGTAQIDGVRVTMVDATHSSDIDADGTLIPGGEAAGFVVAFGRNACVYHAGDTALFGDMRLIRDLYAPDVVLLPIGGYYTMGPREAARACELLGPKYIIGMHYGTFPVLAGTPRELQRYLPAKLKKSVLELVPGVPETL